MKCLLRLDRADERFFVLHNNAVEGGASETKRSEAVGCSVGNVGENFEDEFDGEGGEGEVGRRFVGLKSGHGTGGGGGGADGGRRRMMMCKMVCSSSECCGIILRSMVKRSVGRFMKEWSIKVRTVME